MRRSHFEKWKRKITDEYCLNVCRLATFGPKFLSSQKKSTCDPNISLHTTTGIWVGVK